ncbi:MAG: hypothetical protein HZB16_20255 [Armatimonadetes bacterium]|nr:hypothetical protein [Armatimonadota bacterium]
MLTWRRVVMGLMVLALGGCGGQTATAVTDLAAARSRWRASGSANYHLTLATYCFCPDRERIVVTVRNGVLSTANWETSGTPVPAGQLSLALTIEGLFAKLEDAYQRHAATVTVTYNAADGHPEHIAIDYDLQMADEEIGYGVSSFARD